MISTEVEKTSGYESLYREDRNYDFNGEKLRAYRKRKELCSCQSSEKAARKRKERLIRGDGENRRDGRTCREAVFDKGAGKRHNRVYRLRERRYIAIAVTIAERSHLFSYRTQKLSSLTPKVLEDHPPGG